MGSQKVMIHGSMAVEEESIESIHMVRQSCRMICVIPWEIFRGPQYFSQRLDPVLRR